MKKIYSINWDYNHSEDMERDAFHIPFENSDKASTLFLSSRYKDKLPDYILFRANFNIIPEFDYPLTDLNVPILSDRMISILNEIDDFEAIFTKVIMLDDTYLESIYDETGNLKSEIKTALNYKALTIVNREDCFDFENSIYQPSELNPNKPGFIEKLVLKSTEYLPPIFRIRETPSKLLITESAKSALEKNDIKGCVFEEVETTSPRPI
tara:strand:- start:598 stop:1227 length:630 start_codon:yes stop_codon:yes gene_type:complete